MRGGSGQSVPGRGAIASGTHHGEDRRFSSNLLPSRTFQGTPMRHRGVPVGNFYLVEVLVLFASQAATAIANARAATSLIAEWMSHGASASVLHRAYRRRVTRRVTPCSGAPAAARWRRIASSATRRSVCGGQAAWNS